MWERDSKCPGQCRTRGSRFWVLKLVVRELAEGIKNENRALVSRDPPHRYWSVRFWPRRRRTANPARRRGQRTASIAHLRRACFRRLRPLRASGTVTDTPIVANPLNRDDLLLGSVDYNCGQESDVGFHLSRDGGSTWERVECMAAITTKQNNYLALDEPSVGYDRNGTAYIAGIYFNVEEFGGQGLVAVQKSTDGTHWSKPVVALRRPGQT